MTIGPTTDRTQYDKDRDDQVAAEQKRLAEEADKANDEAAVRALEAQGKTHEEAEKIVKDQREAAKKAQEKAAEEAQQHSAERAEAQHTQGQRQQPKHK